jgi:protein TonB
VTYKILIIDHDPDSFEEMMRPLIGAGYEVVVATDADQGLDAFVSIQPDLTMIEAFPPQSDGPQLCRQLRQTESGQSRAIFLFHDIDHGEDASQSPDECDYTQIIDRPVNDQKLLDLCERLLSVERVAEAPGVEASGSAIPSTDTDTFLNTEQLDNAVGRLNLIIDGEADQLVPEAAPGTAGQRGDFSYVADELKTIGSSPAEVDVPAEEQVAMPPAASLSETLASDALGDEISVHVDTLFAGGATSAPASDVVETVSVATSPAGDQPLPSESAVVSPVMAEVPQVAEAPKEPRVETKPAPALVAPPPAASRPAPPPPAPPRVTQSQTAAVLRAPARKTAPATVAPSEESAGRSKLWFVAASIAIVILGGALALFLSRGSSPDPVAAIADVPPPDNSGSETIASVGLPAPEAAPSLPVPLPQQADSTEPKPDQTPRTQTSPKKTTAPAKVAKPDPPKPAPRISTPPKRTTRQPPKRETRPEPKRTTEPVTEPATTTPAVNPVVEDAEETTPPPTPTPEPVTETAPLTPPSEPTPEPAAPVATADTAFHPPVVVERVEPVYPRKARKKNAKGTIVINVLVSASGSIARVVVDKGIPGSELEAAAMNAVMRWTFEPATEGGEPVKAWTKAEFVFD